MKRRFDFTQLALYALWGIAIGILVASIVFCCGDVLAPDIVDSDCIEETTSCSLSTTNTTTTDITTTETTTAESATEMSSDSTMITTDSSTLFTSQLSSSTTNTTRTTLTSTVTTTATSETIQNTSSATLNSSESSMAEETTIISDSSSEGTTYLGSFRGTYYRGSENPCKGGSGRTLIDCACGNGEVKGSIACRFIYANYGYDVGGRTKVYIDAPDYPSMTGWYYVDDCCASYSVVDFYYPDYSTCPFRASGVISVKLYI